MAGIKDYSTDPASNTALFPEGMPPSAVNDGMRQVQADLRAYANEAEWFEFGAGDGPAAVAYLSATSFSLAGPDATAEYHAGRRLRATGALTGRIYGSVVSSSYAGGATTVTAAWDTGALASEPLAIALAALRADNPSAPAATDGRRGTVELATTAELLAGTDAGRVATPDSLAALWERGSNIASESV